MNTPARLGWLVAVLLALSLIAPFVTPASAMQTEAAQPPTVFQTGTPEPVEPEYSVDNQEQPPADDAPAIEASGEPVVPAETYDLPIFKIDRLTSQPIGGAGFTVFAGECPGGDAIGAEQFTGAADAADGSAGRTIFTGLAGGSYCVVETTVPSGYSGGGTVTVSLPENASGWTFTNDPLPAETWNLPIFKVDSETDQLLGGAGFTLYSGACPASGDPVRGEQFTGAADASDGTAGRTIFTELPEGAYCAVETTAPEGYSGGGSASVSLPENSDGWTFTNDLLAADTWDLPIFKIDSTTDALLGGAGFTLYAGACPASGDPVRGEQFTGASDASDGSAGRTIFTGLPEGAYCAVETTAPAGYSGGSSATIGLPENRDGWTFQNDPLPVETYDLPIFKEDSVTGAKIGGAGFTLYSGACPASGTGSFEQFTGSADAVDGSAGRTIFTDLAAGTYCVVETTGPAGYVGGGSQTLSLPANASGWTFLNDPIADTGTLSLLKRFCVTDDPDDAGTFFTEPGNAFDCILGAASFYAWPVGNPEGFYGPFTTSSESGHVALGLPAGAYMLEEIGSGTQFAFSIVAGQTTEIPVWNVLWDEGSLYVTKIYCKSKFDTTDISFDYPDAVDAAGWDWGHKPKCWQGNANFEVWLFGDPNDVIVFQTGADGEVWLTLPETTEATGPHKLVETSTGTWAWFNITRGQITYATVTNYFRWEHPRPTPPVTPVPSVPSGPVTTLPQTGAAGSPNDAWFLFAVSLAGLAGIAGFALRRTSAPR